jgi:hypothetical protein
MRRPLGGGRLTLKLKELLSIVVVYASVAG